MENFAPEILGISSDEEAGFGETRKEGCDDAWDVENHDWLSKLLAEVDANTVDSDDAMVVREAIPVTGESNILPLKPTAKIEDSDDDDCVILDGDPDKLLAVKDGRVNIDDSDDLVVIAEKGQVACRDFPHPRHLCAKFPFASTPHERRCDQCHCYVCESIAPCCLWGTGISSHDHCHATEKEEFWRAQRKSLKNSDNVSPVTVLRSVDNTSFLRGLSRTTQVLPSTPLPPNYRTLNIRNQGRNQPPGFSVPRSRFQPYLVAQQLQNTSNNNGNLSVRNRSVWNSVPRVKHTGAVFKRNGHFGASANNNCRYNNSDYGSKISGDPFLKDPVLNSYSSSNQPTMQSSTANTVYSQLGVSVPPNMGGFYSNCVPSQPQMSPQPYSSYLVTNSVRSQPQLPSQPFPASNLVTVLPSQSQVTPQLNVRNNTENSFLSQSQLVFQPQGPAALLQTRLPKQPNIGSGFQNHLHSQSLKTSQPNMVKAYERHSSSLPKTHSYPEILSNDDQYIFQQGDRTESGFNTSCSDFGCNFDACLSRCNYQQLSVVGYQHHHAAPSQQSVPREDDSHHQNGPQENECFRQFEALAENCSLTDDIGFPFS
ncbi:Hypothetical predicted protein [Olea europaea subsp. europaea]|uniref:RPM1 interacting protein 13 n=1 Tax=Olea europaea subsp. europaea TaxID=158383 RepID=A0A8S0SY09_OLEEU|nr:Hypothetical predicted protein [Olea europaea subsp. europaea]